MTSDFRIGERVVGGDAPAFVIAEVGQAHEGSLGTAHAYIDAVADAGADAIKFQTHLATAESTRDESFRVHFSDQDETRFDYWRRMEFSPAQWETLAKHARERGLSFISSAFSVAAVDLLVRVGVPAWKVGSGELASFDVLDAMAATGKPILLSTGMSTYEEIDAAVNRCHSGGAGLALLQCTSSYPAPLEVVGLNVLSELRSRFGCPVGLSDHSGSLWPSVASMTLGASVVEVHVVFDRRIFSPDVSSSLTLDEFAQLVTARDAIQVMRTNPVDKDEMATRLGPMRDLFTKSVATTCDLPAGTLLSNEHLTTKKPGTGIPSEELSSLIGRRLRRAVRSDRLLKREDLDG